MKRILLVLAVLCLLVGLSACTTGQKPVPPVPMESHDAASMPEEFFPVTEPAMPYFDESENLYQQVLQRLENYDNSRAKTVGLRAEDGEFLIDTLTSLGDYKDSKQILKRLSVCHDQLIYTKETGWDRLGNERGISTGNNFYDGAGRVIQTDDTEFSYQLGIMRNSQDILYISYQENGQVENVKVVFFGDVSVLATPVYDEIGTLTQMHLMRNSGDSISTFTYDSENRLIGVQMTDEHGDKWNLSYEYDEDGNRIRRTLQIKSWVNTTYRTNYFYEEAKLIRKETVITSESHDPITSVTEYSYGADGRISGYQFTTDSPYETYKNTECIYTYGDSYSYTPDK